MSEAKQSKQEFIEDVIFTPVFEGTRYKYHLCSSCGNQIRIRQDIFSPIQFDGYEDVKYCPMCGNHIIRFEKKPIYEKEINFEPLRPFYEEWERYERRLRWLYYCILHDKKEEIEALIPFAKESPAYGWVGIACSALNVAKKYNTGWREKKRLIEEFGSTRK